MLNLMLILSFEELVGILLHLAVDYVDVDVQPSTLLILDGLFLYLVSGAVLLRGHVKGGPALLLMVSLLQRQDHLHVPSKGPTDTNQLWPKFRSEQKQEDQTSLEERTTKVPNIREKPQATRSQP
ncbi:hypothetical protein Nepgr_033893 [Nepenthes gracilis]|uniref:Uncharacterized protein n=1 Tax=Nepenthes gracilis TaxID=150966 RepID=A0AAD3TML3_NEPGR|nr:hypothetical protein Nepgr_033893 [Nepenthes gracilis]